MLVVGRISREIKLKSRIKRSSNQKPVDQGCSSSFQLPSDETQFSYMKHARQFRANAIGRYTANCQAPPTPQDPDGGEPNLFAQSFVRIHQFRLNQTLLRRLFFFLAFSFCSFSTGKVVTFFFLPFERGGPTSDIKERFRSQNKTTTQQPMVGFGFCAEGRTDYIWTSAKVQRS